MQTDSNRWVRAQEYEKAWWDQRKAQLNFQFYKQFADDLLKETHDIIEIHRDTRILEIGSGAGGILTYLESDHRYAMDPLEDFYKTVPEFTQHRDNSVRYCNAKAEVLPFENRFFDFIICDNVLDHCDDVDEVLEEMKRVLKNEGVVYIRLNLYSKWSVLVRKVVELLKLDPGHPYTFTNKILTQYYIKHDFIIIKEKGRHYLSRLKKSFQAGMLKGCIKAFTFSIPNKKFFFLKVKSNT